MKDIRVQKGYTQRQISNISKVNFRLLQNYEQCVCNIDKASIDKLLSLSIALDCKISDIIENDELASELKTRGC